MHAYLDSNADGAVAQVGVLRRWNRAAVDVYDAVQVTGHLLGDLVEPGVVEMGGACPAPDGHIPRQREGRQGAHSHTIPRQGGNR